MKKILLIAFLLSAICLAEEDKWIMTPRGMQIESDSGDGNKMIIAPDGDIYMEMDMGDGWIYRTGGEDEGMSMEL